MDRPPCAEAAVGAEDIGLAPRFDEGVAGPGQQFGDPCQKRQVQVTDLQLVGENALPYLRCRQSAARILLVQDPDGGIVQYLVALRSEEPTSELQSLMRITYAVYCLK